MKSSPTCGDNSTEGGEPLPAGVTAAPAVILGPVDQIDVPWAQHRHRGNPPRFRVRVHALNDQHLIVDVVRTLVGLPVGLVRAVGCPEDPWEW